MIPFTLAEIAEATGGRLADAPDPGARVSAAVEFDSREITPGGLFAALPGDRADGHDFVAAAIAAGAVAALTTRPVGVPAVVVPDVQDALAALATAVLARRPDLTVIGLTGSSGKTSTKDLLTGPLERLGPTVATPKSFNNEVGHPYTALRVTDETRYLLLEKSARGVGHIAFLCRVAPPDIGVVLNVGDAHLGEFGSLDETARAKGELVEALPATGLAVLNADDPRVAAMAGRTAARVVTFGVDHPANVRATEVRSDRRGRASYTLRTGDDAVPVRLGVYGPHQVSNSLAAAAVALELGMSPGEIADALGRATPRSRYRMEVTDRPDGVTVVNDAYNANPDSMAAALRALAAMSDGRRSWAVLGRMRELGEHADERHGMMGRLAARLGIDRLVVVGPKAARIHTAAIDGGMSGEEAVRVPDVESAIDLLRRRVRPDDVVLVKATNADAMWRVAEALLPGRDGAGEYEA